MSEGGQAKPTLEELRKRRNRLRAKADSRYLTGIVLAAPIFFSGFALAGYIRLPKVVTEALAEGRLQAATAAMGATAVFLWFRASGFANRADELTRIVGPPSPGKVVRFARYLLTEALEKLPPEAVEPGGDRPALQEPPAPPPAEPEAAPPSDEPPPPPGQPPTDPDAAN